MIEPNKQKIQFKIMEMIYRAKIKMIILNLYFMIYTLPFPVQSLLERFCIVVQLRPMRLY